MCCRFSMPFQQTSCMQQCLYSKSGLALCFTVGPSLTSMTHCAVDLSICSSCASTHQFSSNRLVQRLTFILQHLYWPLIRKSRQVQRVWIISMPMPWHVMTLSLSYSETSNRSALPQLVGQSRLCCDTDGSRHKRRPDLPWGSSALLSTLNLIAFTWSSLRPNCCTCIKPETCKQSNCCNPKHWTQIFLKLRVAAHQISRMQDHILAIVPKSQVGGVTQLARILQRCDREWSSSVDSLPCGNNTYFHKMKFSANVDWWPPSCRSTMQWM